MAFYSQTCLNLTYIHSSSSGLIFWSYDHLRNVNCVYYKKKHKLCMKQLWLEYKVVLALVVVFHSCSSLWKFCWKFILSQFIFSWVSRKKISAKQLSPKYTFLRMISLLYCYFTLSFLFFFFVFTASLIHCQRYNYYKRNREEKK